MLLKQIARECALYPNQGVRRALTTNLHILVSTGGGWLAIRQQ